MALTTAQRCRKCYIKHKEQRLEYQRKYYFRNKDKIKVNMLKRYYDNKNRKISNE